MVASTTRRPCSVKHENTATVVGIGNALDQALAFQLAHTLRDRAGCHHPGPVEGSGRELIGHPGSAKRSQDGETPEVDPLLSTDAFGPAHHELADTQHAVEDLDWRHIQLRPLLGPASSDFVDEVSFTHLSHW